MPYVHPDDYADTFHSATAEQEREADDDWCDEYDGPDEYDVFAEAEANCGSRRHRQCDLAGTEYCDWRCPIRNEVFPPRKTRGRA